MSDSGYKRVVTYHFECAGEHWALSMDSEDCVTIEETRKNGQEDTHMSLDLFLVDGTWQPEDDLGKWNTVVSYLGRGAVTELAAYVNKHGIPGEEP